MFFRPHAQPKQPLVQSAVFLMVIGIPQCAHLNVNGRVTSGIAGFAPFASFAPEGAWHGGQAGGVAAAKTTAEKTPNIVMAIKTARTVFFADFIDRSLVPRTFSILAFAIIGTIILAITLSNIRKMADVWPTMSTDCHKCNTY
jgi:hypothetical protein